MQCLKLLSCKTWELFCFQRRFSLIGFMYSWPWGILRSTPTGRSFDYGRQQEDMPLVQALDYVEELPRLEQPRFVVTCNFETFRVYDRDAWAKS